MSLPVCPAVQQHLARLAQEASDLDRVIEDAQAQKTLVIAERVRVLNAGHLRLAPDREAIQLSVPPPGAPLPPPCCPWHADGCSGTYCAIKCSWSCERMFGMDTGSMGLLGFTKLCIRKAYNVPASVTPECNGGQSEIIRMFRMGCSNSMFLAACGAGKTLVSILPALALMEQSGLVVTIVPLSVIKENAERNANQMHGDTFALSTDSQFQQSEQGDADSTAHITRASDISPAVTPGNAVAWNVADMFTASILFTTPEKLYFDSVLVQALCIRASKGMLSRFVIDEADYYLDHQDDRPVFSELKEYLDVISSRAEAAGFSLIPVVLITATAPLALHQEIFTLLGTPPTTAVVNADLNNPKLHFAVSVLNPNQRYIHAVVTAICSMVVEVRAAPAYELRKIVVFVFSIKEAERLAKKLETSDLFPGGVYQYHGGMLHRQKQLAEFEASPSDQLSVLVATGAGERGLDVSEVDLTIVASPVTNLRANFQQLHRGARTLPGLGWTVIHFGALNQMVNLVQLEVGSKAFN
eukprot:gene25331-35348_t